MNRIILILSLSFFFAKLFGQNEYIVKCLVKVSASSCPRCADNPINQVSLNEIHLVPFFNDPKGDIIDGSNYKPYDIWRTKYIKVQTGSVVSFEFYDPVAGNNQYLSYYSVPGNTTISPSGDYHSTDGLTRWHSVWLNAEATTYDAVEITNVNFICSQTDCNGPNKCVSGDDGVFNFTLSVQNHLSPTVYIEAYERTSNGYNFISSVQIALFYPYTRPLYFSEFGLKNYYNKDIVFRARTEFPESLSIYSGYTNSMKFFRQMPAIQNISVQRTACTDDKIFVTLDPSVISKLNQYRFRARPSGITEKISNITPFKVESVTGNTVQLSIDTAVLKKTLSVSEGRYIFQVFGVELPLDADSSKITCAVTKEFDVAAKPSLLLLSSYPTTYNFTDNAQITHTYHITKKGANDGEVKLEIIGNLNGRTAHFEFSNDNLNWSSTPSLPEKLVSKNNSIYYTSLSPNKKYYVRVVDSDGCPSEGKLLDPLIEPDPVSISTTGTSLVTCHMNNPGRHTNGQITAGFAGGIGPYRFTVKDGSGQLVYSATDIYTYSSQTDTILGVGQYTLVIKDSYEVSDTSIISVGSNPEMILTATPTRLNCYNDNSGSVLLSVQDKGTTFVNFALTNQSTKERVEDASTTFPELSAGTYTATVTNTDGCRDSVTDIVVSQPDSIKITATGSKIAKYGGNTGTIDMVITGGTGSFNYTLSKEFIDIIKGNTNNNALITGLNDGKYSLLVIDEKRCPKEEKNIYVRQPDAPLELQYTKLNVDCYGNSSGKVYPVASGGWRHYQYGFNGNITGSDNVISGLVATSSVADTVFVVDSAGVSEKLPVTITQPDKLISSVKTIGNLRCFNDYSGSVILNVKGGTPAYSVSTDNLKWYAGTSLTGLAANENMTIYIKDKNNCPAYQNVKITQPDKLKISTDTIIDAFCSKNNGAIHTIVNGGTIPYTYQWYNFDINGPIGSNSSMLPDIFSGRYGLVVTDDHQCKDLLEFPVSDMDGPKVIGYNIDSTSCFGGDDGKIHITGIKGGMPEYHYYLNGKETLEDMVGLSSGNYHIRVIDDKGCKTENYYTVYQPDDILISGLITAPVCHNSYDGTIESTVSGGNGPYSYNWSSGSLVSVLKDQNKGNFTLLVTDRKGCKKEKSFELIPPAMPTSGWPETSAVLCTGNVKTLDGGEFIAYEWRKNNQLVSTKRYYTLEEQATYTLKMTTHLGCTGIDTFQLKLSDHPLDAVLLLKDSALVNETVEAIDVTWPIPDSISWNFSKPVLMGNSNEWYQQFSSESTGIVNVTLRAWYGGCFSDSSKTVTVYYHEGEVSQLKTDAMPLILGFKAFPNPNEGDFRVKIQLSRQANILLKIYNLQNNTMIMMKEYEGLDQYNIPFQLSDLPIGVYVIILIAEKEQQGLKMVIGH